MLRKAATISANAHIRAMSLCRPGMTEYQIEAELLHEFMRQGAYSAAYPCIVGSGANSCVLHYIDNTRKMQEGDILLIDAGAEYECYASDITRTFPVNGRFSDSQRAVYEVVLAAQLAAIDAVRPGNHWDQPHAAAVEVLTEGLVELGILKGTPETLIAEQAYKRYFMHKTGHWLGMDVHDVGDYKIGEEWRLLEPGMTLTVEPGLYFQPQEGLAREWWNIGVRIEDDVLVTKTEPEVLSRNAPKTIAEIETLMAQNG